MAGLRSWRQGFFFFDVLALGYTTAAAVSVKAKGRVLPHVYVQRCRGSCADGMVASHIYFWVGDLYVQQHFRSLVIPALSL